MPSLDKSCNCCGYHLLLEIPLRLLWIGLLAFMWGGCANSHYHASYRSNQAYVPKRTEHQHISINKIAIGSISSSAFWEYWQRAYFRRSLEDALYTKAKIRVVARGRSAYRINVDIYDYSGKPKEKMGKFLGQKQYRVVQDYNIRAWYRIEKIGARNTLKQGTAEYRIYYDMASNKSYAATREKAVKQKLEGIAKEVADEVIAYFYKSEKSW